MRSIGGWLGAAAQEFISELASEVQDFRSEKPAIAEEVPHTEQEALAAAPPAAGEPPSGQAQEESKQPSPPAATSPSKDASNAGSPSPHPQAAPVPQASSPSTTVPAAKQAPSEPPVTAGGSVLHQKLGLQDDEDVCWDDDEDWTGVGSSAVVGTTVQTTAQALTSAAGTVKKAEAAQDFEASLLEIASPTIDWERKCKELEIEMQRERALRSDFEKRCSALEKELQEVKGGLLANAVKD